MKEFTSAVVLDDSRVRHTVVQLFCEILGVQASSLDEDELLSNYGVNSVDLIDAVVRLETHFGIQFDPEKMACMSCRKFADNILAELAAG